MKGHLLTGKTGEDIAEQYLRGRGYRPLGRNVKTRRGEIDLVMQQGSTVVFVEVKSRTYVDMFSPSDRVDSAKVQRLLGAASLWLERRGADVPARIDVIGVCNGEVVEHYEDVTS
jgi:putative endonuclease